MDNSKWWNWGGRRLSVVLGDVNVCMQPFRTSPSSTQILHRSSACYTKIIHRITKSIEFSNQFEQHMFNAVAFKLFFLTHSIHICNLLWSIFLQLLSFLVPYELCALCRKIIFDYWVNLLRAICFCVHATIFTSCIREHNDYTVYTIE